MRRFAILLTAAILMASCSVMTHERIIETKFMDFRPYSDAGFFLSPDPYPGEFEALGEVLVKVTPAVTKKTMSLGGKYGDGVYASSGLVKEEISGEELIDLVVKAALEKGADGLADFQCDVICDETGVVTRYEVSGLAIKRKK